jgi:hypothetical protein
MKGAKQHMGQLDYDGKMWRGENAVVRVAIPDDVFQKHVTKYLASKGITEPTDTERAQALRELADVEQWEGVEDQGIVKRMKGTRPAHR